MAFIFAMRSTVDGKMHRRDNTSSTTNSSLPVIAEDGTSIISRHDTPPVPTRATNRPPNHRFGLRAPPILFRDNNDQGPPAYTQFETVIEGPHGEKLVDVRKGFHNNKHIAKRGGWKRLLIILLIILCLIALIVGLVVGLKKKKHTDSAGDDSSGTSSSSNNGPSTPAGGASGTIQSPPSNQVPNSTFPAGSYRIDTYLSTVATNCTSNPATWLCYPYSTYAQDASASLASYDWIITPINITDSKTKTTTTNYTISSTPNIFSITFTNASLSLLNEGTDLEHYFFQTTLQKPTKPSSPLGDSNIASTCYFNSTTFHAYLYTKMPKTYPTTLSGDDDSRNSTGSFVDWPYAVKIEQVAASGVGEPDCVDPEGNSVGDFSVEDDGQLCDCLYLNTGT